ncbi:sulfite exporter TauE/SafE family protein [Magnetococcus sp. PR-3]|uniref:sulfite exporter TauE/SafE family protein n=1 Tax=Magnetococcus sp. PR-3 TaxID=3120355 RepID=UPI002FCE300C
MLTLIIASACAGLLAGVIAGLFGVGGGIILVPTLLLLFVWHGVDATVVMQMAVATSLATIIVTNLSATWHHHKRNAVLWPMVRWFAPGLLLGAWSGAWLAAWMEGDQLRMLFGLFEVLVGIKMLTAKKDGGGVGHHWPRWSRPVMGGLIGGISSLFGIGGGTLSVPTLSLLFDLPMQRAVATSSAMGLVLALFGTVGFVQAGQGVANLPPWGVGFIAWPVFLSIIAATLITTPFGVKLAHGMDAVKLKKGFGLFLLLVGIKLVLG